MGDGRYHLPCVGYVEHSQVRRGRVTTCTGPSAKVSKGHERHTHTHTHWVCETFATGIPDWHAGPQDTQHLGRTLAPHKAHASMLVSIRHTHRAHETRVDEAEARWLCRRCDS